jgi:hypothetical protein
MKCKTFERRRFPVLLGCAAMCLLAGAGLGQAPEGEHVLVTGGITSGTGVSGLMSSPTVMAAGIPAIAPSGAAPCVGVECTVQAGFFAQAGQVGLMPHPLVAAFSLYGNGTQGATGVPAIGWSSQVDATGASVTLSLGAAAPNAPALLLLGLAPAAETLAGGQATLLVDMNALLFPDLSAPDPFIITSATGSASVGFQNLPMSGVAGSSVCAQWFILDAQGPVVVPNLGGVALTRGLHIQF